MTQPAPAEPTGPRRTTPANIPPTAPLPKSTDALVLKVTEQIARLADGNPLPKKNIAFEGSRIDRPVLLRLNIAFDFTLSTQTAHGATHPNESIHCADDGAVSARLASARSLAVSNIALKEVVANSIRADPLRTFEKLEDDFPVASPPLRVHRCSKCSQCGATGQQRCNGLICQGTGKVNCCCFDGKEPCRKGCAGGMISYNVNIWNPVARQYWTEPRRRLCSCNSGRDGTCPMCRGTAKLDCPHCRGSGYQNCGNCSATGWLTVITTAKLVGKPSREVIAPKEASPAFHQQLARFRPKSIPEMCSEVKPGPVVVTDTGLLSTLNCALPHTEITAKFDLINSERFNAFGTTAVIPMMPPFLDRLLYNLVDDIGVAVDGGDMAGAVNLARTSRFTAAALIAVGQKENRREEALVHIYEGAASKEFATELLKKLTRAYHGLGRSSIRRTWLLLGSPALTAAAMLPYALTMGTFGVPWSKWGIAPNNRGIFALFAGVVPALLVSFIARRRARGAVATLLGDHAKRAPRQGRWLAAGLGLSLVAGFIGQEIATDNILSAQGTPLLGKAVESPTVTPVALSPSKFPARTRPPLQASVTGAAAVLQTQRGLQELGFYHGPVDGRMSRDVGQSMGRLLALVPQDQTWRLRSLGDSGMVQAVMRDEIRLGHLPTDGFVTARLSNFTRANISREDMTKVLGAASRAASHPGTEVRWSSTDGQRGVRAIASRAGPGCLIFDVEIRVRGAVEATGPEKACGPVNTTTWSQP